MKSGAEIGQIFPVSSRLAFPPVHFPQTLSEVKPDLGLRRLQGEGGIPGPAVGTVEAAALGTRVGKSRIHNMPVGNTKYQFMDGNTGQPIRFSQQAFVACALELKQIL